MQCFLLFLLASCLSVSSGHDEFVHTIQLTSENFSKEIKESNFFVMFFAPWCGHCKRLAPTWEQLAEMLNTKEGSRVKIGRVDCTEEDSVCSAHEVTGYPTLKFFKLGETESIKFRGTRDLPTLTTFINEQLGETDKKEEEEEEKPELPEATQGLQELTDETFGKFVATGKHFVKFYAPWCGHCQKLAPTWTELANALEHEKGVSISKLDCTQYRPICQDFEVKGYPSLLWIEDGKKVEKYSGARSLEDLKAYVDKMVGKEAKVVEKSPEDVKEEAPQVALQLTGSTFDHAIETGVTFVKFFAPWCGHCKRLAPTWEELAVKFVGNGNVKIAKVDCTVAENKELCSNQEVDGFPTLHLYKAGAKLEEYNGSRSLDALYQFVEKHDKGHDEL
uniref:Putative thioredoxin/protein disulfide isomerase n=1 Tax=Nyssomyia neivai TaxID=330878 RepID=A0A1L8DU05_9DIPT